MTRLPLLRRPLFGLMDILSGIFTAVLLIVLSPLILVVIAIDLSVQAVSKLRGKK